MRTYIWHYLYPSCLRKVTLSFYVCDFVLSAPTAITTLISECMMMSVYRHDYYGAKSLEKTLRCPVTCALVTSSMEPVTCL